MRPYRIVDESYDDDEYPRVVPIRPGGRGRSVGTLDRPRPEPWIPRDVSLPTAPRRLDGRVTSSSGSSRAFRWLLVGVLIVCVGMVLGIVLVRLWDEASRAVAALPPETSAGSSRHEPAPTPVPTAVPTPAPAEAAERGAVTTEIRVLQPNYTVAPGDTLGIIARRHGTSVEALASINNLENRNSLSVGQKLIIP